MNQVLFRVTKTYNLPHSMMQLSENLGKEEEIRKNIIPALQVEMQRPSWKIILKLVSDLYNNIYLSLF